MRCSRSASVRADRLRRRNLRDDGAADSRAALHHVSRRKPTGRATAGIARRNPGRGPVGRGRRARISDRSLLLAKVVSGQMPMGGDRLPEEEIHAIREWIDASGRSNELVQTVRTTGVGRAAHIPDALPALPRQEEAGGRPGPPHDAGRLKGGASGPALVPGNPEESLLVQRIVAGEMPPPDMLFENHIKTPTDTEVALLRKWNRGGSAAAGGR